MEQSAFLFTTPFNVRIEKKGDLEEIHLDGFVSTTDQDLVDDVVTKNCLESMKKQIMEKNLKLDIEHESFRGKSAEEKEINKTKLPIGRMYDATVEQIGHNRWGLRVKSVLNNFHSRFNEIKGSIMNKFLDAYSIAFLPTKVSHEEINGKSVRFLDDDILLNVALTGNPINTTAQNRDVIVKAIDSIDAYNEEKKSNPGIENALIVKSGDNTDMDEKAMMKCPKCGYEMKEEKNRADNQRQARKEALEGDEEDEEEKKKKKEEKNNHESDNQLNKPGGKIMETEEKTQTENALPETVKAVPEEKDNEIVSLKGEIESLKSQVADLTAKLKAPVQKSIAEQMPKEVTEKKSLGPLDQLS